LAGNSSEEISSPLYATAVGLVMNSISNNTHSAYKIELKEFREVPKQEVPTQVIEEKPVEVDSVEEKKVFEEKETTNEKIKRSFFDKYVDKIKDFLDNAE
jgi:cell division protein FtsA